jgi:hypothetical protein
MCVYVCKCVNVHGELEKVTYGVKVSGMTSLPKMPMLRMRGAMAAKGARQGMREGRRGGSQGSKIGEERGQNCGYEPDQQQAGWRC